MVGTRDMGEREGGGGAKQKHNCKTKELGHAALHAVF